MHDQEDLETDGVFLVSNDAVEVGRDSVLPLHLFLWVGAEYPLQGNEGAAAKRIFDAFAASKGISLDRVQTTLIFEDAETDEFWDCFSY